MNPIARQLRIAQVAFIVTVGLIYYVSGTVPPVAHSVNSSIQWAIVLCAIASVLAGFIVQRTMLRTPSQFLPAAQHSTVLVKWKAGHILRFATAESAALFGLVLHTLGSSSVLVNILFGSSILLLLFWQPGAIPAQSESQSSIG
jgi:protein-S-isoprenylcysteine O-methyltransferase Ste14